MILLVSTEKSILMYLFGVALFFSELGAELAHRADVGQNLQNNTVYVDKGAVGGRSECTAGERTGGGAGEGSEWGALVIMNGPRV